MSGREESPSAKAREALEGELCSNHACRMTMAVTVAGPMRPYCLMPALG